MKKSTQRKLALGIAGLLTLSLMAACGNSKKEESKSAVPGTAPTATEAALSGPKPVLKALLPNQTEDYNTYPVAKLLEEKTGYKVQYETLPQDKPEDKLNLIMASAQEYDFITIPSGLKERYAQYAKQGAVTALDSYIDKYGKNIKAMVSAETNNGLKIDGKLYAIGSPRVNYTDKGSLGSAILVRQDWMEKLGLSDPKTLDEFTVLLTAIKEKDPGGLKDKNVPMTCTPADIPSQIAGAFGVQNFWIESEGKIINQIEAPGFKDYALYIQDLYKKGLLDKDFATNKTATEKEKFSAGRVGAMPQVATDLPSLLDALNKNVPGAKTKYILPMTGKDGKAGIEYIQNDYDRITFIPKFSKNIDHTVNYINMKLDKDVFKESYIGVEGKHYTQKDGQYMPIAPIFFDEFNRANNFVTGVDEKNYAAYWSARIKKDIRVFNAYDALNKDFLTYAKTDITKFAPILTEYSKNDQSLKTMVQDYITKVVLGSENIDKLPDFIKKFKEAGGDASAKELNDWYKTYKK